ncbi:DNA transposase THAP9 [Alligator mississippiensis]|uniref:DNA transposase THAP9 n=1 Tax=Alligator mississippiensis TaxID=8496 RepID=A0A151MB72_ALLMI|nr:DNA transposase THAP9 [Alligator mississippiensis]
MPKACSAINCPNRDTRESRARGLSFHSFPKAHELRKRWLLAVRRVEPGSRRLWVPGAGACLCSQHFAREEFELHGGQRRLKAGVIPSLFSFKKSPRGQRPTRSLKAMGTNIPAAGPGEAILPADVSPTQAKAVELIQAEHQYSLTECMEDRTQPSLLPSLVLGNEREQDAAKRRLTYCRQELQSVLEGLKEQNLLCEDIMHMLRAQFADLQLNLHYEGTQPGNYSAATRNFAVSLHLFSAKAYESVRRTFQLPEPATLRMWLSNQDYGPGFSQQTFSALAERSQAGDRVFQYCSLLFGAMPLERKVHYNQLTKCMQGLIDFGAGVYDADEVPAAREAVVFIAVGFQGHWTAPLGYFLLATLTGDIQAQLLRHCILKLHDIGIQVVSVTSDATAPSVDTARRLGVVVDGVSVKSTFFHPATPVLEVTYFFDPCHLLTLVHNTLQAHGSLQVSGKAIYWDYILRLGLLQQEEVVCRLDGMGLSGQRMWGNGAAQLFSKSTAQALHFVASLGLPQFQGHEVTAHFLRLLGRVFDNCSSRSIHGKGPKAPLTLASSISLNSLCNEYENLLRKLRDASGELLGLSKHRWGFLGFLVNLRSLQQMSRTYLEAEDGPMPYLLPGWWSLDPLQWWLEAIQQACGERGTPTAQAFQLAYRHVLQKGLTKLGTSVPSLLDVSLNRRASLQLQATWPLEKGKIWLDHWYLGSRQVPSAIDLAPSLLAQVEEDKTTSIACFVVQKMLPLLPCAKCRAALLSSSGVQPAGSALLCLEKRRGLHLPAASVRRVIRRAERILGLSMWLFRNSGQPENWGSALELAILTDMSEEPGLFPSLHNHLFENNAVVSNHYVTLLQGLVRNFLELHSGKWGAVQGPESGQVTEGSHSHAANNRQSLGSATGHRAWSHQIFGLKQQFNSP